MTSIFPIAYGFSKFASGVLGARTSPTLLLGGGLMATALVNIIFGFGASMTWWVAAAVLTPGHLPAASFHSRSNAPHPMLLCTSKQQQSPRQSDIRITGMCCC